MLDVCQKILKYEKMETTVDNLNILIVDDNPKNLQVLGSILMTQNYQLEFATDGKHALSWINEKNFDLIILDIMMPGMSGLEVCEKIRKKNKFREIPIIFLSANTDKDTILRGFDLGGQDYITKPFDARELLARVRTHLELKTSREKLKEVNQWLEQKVKEKTRELKISNEKLTLANKELLSLDKLKADFLELLSHEIRTPLNGIIGPVGILKAEEHNKERATLLEILDVSVKRLEKFSYLGLLITELRSKQRVIEKNELIVRGIAQEAANKLKQSFELKNLAIEISEDVANTKIIADWTLITICFESILNNAVKYSPKNGNITIRIKQSNKHVTCEFSDQGGGFSEEAIKNRFKLFMPGEKHINKNMGVELALVKLIMEAHDGDIEISNQMNGGAFIKLIFTDV